MNDGGTLYRCRYHTRLYAGGTICVHPLRHGFYDGIPDHTLVGTLADYLGVEPPLSMQERAARVLEKWRREQFPDYGPGPRVMLSSYLETIAEEIRSLK